jgi:hypothetical protein
MAWGSKQDDPPKVDQPKDEKPQLSGEEILAKMSELLAPLQTSINATQSRLTAMEEAARVQPEPHDPARLLDDEEKWKQENLTPFAIAQINTNARITESEVFAEVRDQGWGEFIPAIKEILAKTPINVKGEGYETYVRNVVKMMVGESAMKSGLKRKGSTFILEDASGSAGDKGSTQDSADREFLNFEVVTSKGKHVKRGEFLERMGIDIHNPETLKKVKEDWGKVQVVN